ncbi:MAG: L-2-amino-thiazoline-4-carboxylic acid hydrolase [Planctomycetes bacterium]|nr:L-2-amino-thiazoline-4-carboxylic acid hydrolase [Planctomycetota bacterium]
MTDLKAWRDKHTSLICACRTIRDRFGEAAVDAVAAQHMANIREAYAAKARDMGRNDLEAFASQMGGHPLTHDREVLRSDGNVFEVRITRCYHAEVFAEQDARDVGLKFMCAGDEAMIAGFNPKIRLERPELLMNGDACCHFIYTLDE